MKYLLSGFSVIISIIILFGVISGGIALWKGITTLPILIMAIPTLLWRDKEDFFTAYGLGTFFLSTGVLSLLICSFVMKQQTKIEFFPILVSLIALSAANVIAFVQVFTKSLRDLEKSRDRDREESS